MGMIESTALPNTPTLAPVDLKLLAVLQDGLPLVARPYQRIGARIGLSEDEVMQRLQMLQLTGVVKRMGLIVRHHELGYGANAMVVWDVPDDQAGEIGRRLATFTCVTLCYRRARSLPHWRYNLYCMIHGRDRGTVNGHIETINRVVGLRAYAHTALFSGRRFKQCGARYLRTEAGGTTS